MRIHWTASLAACVLPVLICSCSLSQASVEQQIWRDHTLARTPELSNETRRILEGLPFDKVLQLSRKDPVKSTRGTAEYYDFQIAGLDDATKDSLNEAVKKNPNDLATLKTLPKKADEAKPDADKETEGVKKFLGVNFGIGPSAVIDVGGRQRVDSASVVDGVVRAEKSLRAVPRLLLETHYFFPVSETAAGETRGGVGFGPFAALGTSGQDIVESIGLGAMFGFKVNKQTGSSLNIGLGANLDFNCKTLGDGITEGQALPGAETSVRFKYSARGSLLVTLSFSF